MRGESLQSYSLATTDQLMVHYLKTTLEPFPAEHRGPVKTQPSMTLPLHSTFAYARKLTWGLLHEGVTAIFLVEDDKPGDVRKPKDPVDFLSRIPGTAGRTDTQNTIEKDRHQTVYVCRCAANSSPLYSSTVETTPLGFCMGKVNFICGPAANSLKTTVQSEIHYRSRACLILVRKTFLGGG